MKYQVFVSGMMLHLFGSVLRTAILGIFFLLFAVLLQTPSYAGDRYALVIGNDNYQNVPKLVKAINDAQALGEVFAAQGFKVSIAENSTRRNMNRVIQQFVSQLKAGDDAVFFYAGHGLELHGRNYLLPVDVPAVQPSEEDFVKSESIPADEILERIHGKSPRAVIMVLDACRDNPFPKVGSRSVGNTRGFARMTPAKGTFIMYSAGVGQAALDKLSGSDPHPNSVFTRSIIPLLQQPGMSLLQAARQVRQKVETLAATVSHVQRPAYYEDMSGEFYFAGKSKGDSEEPPKTAETPTTVEPNKTTSQTEAAQAWATVKNSGSVGDYMAIVQTFPNTFYARLAQNRIDALQVPSPSNEEDSTIAKVESSNNTEVAINQSTQQSSTPSWYVGTYRNLDLFGGDLGGKPKRAKTIRACANQCGSNSRCKAFTYNAKARFCFLKENFEFAQKFKGALTGVFFRASTKEDAPKFKAIWEVFANADLTGKTIAQESVSSFSGCVDWCNENGNCGGFSYTHFGGRTICRLKGGRNSEPVYTKTSKRGMTSARRIQEIFSVNSVSSAQTR